MRLKEATQGAAASIGKQKEEAERATQLRRQLEETLKQQEEQTRANEEAARRLDIEQKKKDVQRREREEQQLRDADRIKRDAENVKEANRKAALMEQERRDVEEALEQARTLVAQGEEKAKELARRQQACADDRMDHPSPNLAQQSPPMAAGGAPYRRLYRKSRRYRRVRKLKSHLSMQGQRKPGQSNLTSTMGRHV